MERGGYIYILTNKYNTTLYIGVTSNIRVRIIEHLEKKYLQSFTSRYNCTKLIYLEGYRTIEEAIAREKVLKTWKRSWKNDLINSANPKWTEISLEETEEFIIAE